MSNLIQKITIKHKLNNLYHKVNKEYLSTMSDCDNGKISTTSAIFSYRGISNYVASRYNHICESNGVVDADIYSDSKFDGLLKKIETQISLLESELSV